MIFRNSFSFPFTTIIVPKEKYVFYDIIIKKKLKKFKVIKFAIHYLSVEKFYINKFLSISR